MVNVHKLGIHRFSTSEFPGPVRDITFREGHDQLLLGEKQNPDRITVWEDDHSVGYENRHPYFFRRSDPSEVYTTMNGFGAVTLTWPAGADPNFKWGGELALPDLYEECWLTQDIRFETNWVPGQSLTSGTQKLFGFLSNNTPASCQPIACPSNEWIFRIATGADQGEDVLIFDSMYYPEKNNNCADGFDLAISFNRGAILTIEMHFKLNSASGVIDGMAETSVNGTLYSTGPAFKFYCGGETFRAGARAARIRNQMFYGGSGSGWEPFQDSSVTLGRIKVEAPAFDEPQP